jgi:HD-GYP domain-containing protein (c-di-GMP phosphodiesterase class II)
VSRLAAEIGAGLKPVLPWIRHSHEHYDGSGYPDALSGDEITEAARILLVAEAFDAMTSGRPYRPPVTTEVALAELHRCAGAQFDPACVDALERHLGRGSQARRRDDHSHTTAAVRRGLG